VKNRAGNGTVFLFAIQFFTSISGGVNIMQSNDIVSKCIQVEKNAAAIYNELLKLFPEQSDFLRGLFDDEVEHLNFFNDIKSLGLKNELKIIDSPPSLPTLNKTLQLADSIIEEVRTSSVTFKDALEMVLKFEESLAETYTNKLIAHLMSCEDESRFEQLMSDEKKHINKIKKQLELL